jgi:hypothetical protein
MRERRDDKKAGELPFSNSVTATVRDGSLRTTPALMARGAPDRKILSHYRVSEQSRGKTCRVLRA